MFAWSIDCLRLMYILVYMIMLKSYIVLLVATVKWLSLWIYWSCENYIYIYIYMKEKTVCVCVTQ